MPSKDRISSHYTVIQINYTDQCYSKAEEDSNPRLNGNPFQDNQLRASHYTINLFLEHNEVNSYPLTNIKPDHQP